MAQSMRLIMPQSDGYNRIRAVMTTVEMSCEFNKYSSHGPYHVFISPDLDLWFWKADAFVGSAEVYEMSSVVVENLRPLVARVVTIDPTDPGGPKLLLTTPDTTVSSSECLSHHGSVLMRIRDKLKDGVRHLIYLLC